MHGLQRLFCSLTELFPGASALASSFPPPQLLKPEAKRCRCCPCTSLSLQIPRLHPSITSPAENAAPRLPSLLLWQPRGQPCCGTMATNTCMLCKQQHPIAGSPFGYQLQAPAPSPGTSMVGGRRLLSSSSSCLLLGSSSLGTAGLAAANSIQLCTVAPLL